MSETSPKPVMSYYELFGLDSTPHYPNDRGKSDKAPQISHDAASFGAGEDEDEDEKDKSGLTPYFRRLGRSKADSLTIANRYEELMDHLATLFKRWQTTRQPEDRQRYHREWDATQIAWETLRDPQLREAYDQALAGGNPQYPADYIRLTEEIRADRAQTRAPTIDAGDNGERYGLFRELVPLIQIEPLTRRDSPQIALVVSGELASQATQYFKQHRIPLQITPLPPDQPRSQVERLQKPAPTRLLLTVTDPESFTRLRDLSLCVIWDLFKRDESTKVDNAGMHRFFVPNREDPSKHDKPLSQMLSGLIRSKDFRCKWIVQSRVTKMTSNDYKALEEEIGRLRQEVYDWLEANPAQPAIQPAAQARPR